MLVEKEKTVPDTYPLTLNALVAGCNQKSNREPQMAVEPYEVEGALRSLMDREFVVQVDKAGGRTVRYEHCGREQLAVEEADLAILSELMCRGPQTPGELKTRAGRMHPFQSLAEVEGRLRALAARPVPYVCQLERRPREHAARWEHLLGKQDAPSEAAAPDTTPEVPAPPPAVPAPAAVTPPAPSLPADEDLAERVDALAQEVADLRDRLDRLEGR